nr:S46 family peptidase [Chitinophagaceae bacterium]
MFKQRIFGLFVILSVLLSNAFANEGMWLPQLLGQLNEKEMKAMGMKISAKDIYSINSGSLKDAIVSFGGFCTAEVISKEGLILTNHHCGYSAIQNHTTLQNNYLRDGFWAMDKTQELPNPALFATFIIRIDDVTDKVLNGVNPSMTESERQSNIDKNINALKPSVQKEEWQDFFIRAFFDGNKYYLFVTETFRDVRLVGAPPSDIGKFGADTDNWMWPRHTGDFSLFRIYAGPDNKPAAYSKDNKPYIPKKALTINTKGLKDGDFTMVFGFPGRTQQYLPAAALRQTLEYTNPYKISIRDQSLKTIDGFMRADEQVKIQYASKYASTANAWKKWIGEVQGMQFSKAVEKRLNYEKKFQQRVDGNPTFKSSYNNLLPKLNELYEQINPLAKERDIYTETILQTELLRHGTTINRFLNAINSGQNAEEEKKRLITLSNTFYKDFSPAVDKEVAKLLWMNYLVN